MARIELENVNLAFRVRQGGRTSLKEMLVRQLLRKSSNPRVEVRALQDVNLRVKAGDRLGIIGHNGAGKSTLLRLLAGIYPPSSGKRIVEGRISSLFEIALGFELDATGWENIAYRGYLQGETPRSLRSKMQPIAEFTELGRFLDMPVRYYSAGMLVRLAFSIVTSIEPQVLLVDEVLSVGDMAFQNKARQRMLDMMAKADLLVIVSHDMVSLSRLCDRVVWMDHGRVRQIGPASDVITAYTTHVQGNPPEVMEAFTRKRQTSPSAVPAGRPLDPRWEAHDLVQSYYEVQLSWAPDPDRAAGAMYQIHDGPRLLAHVYVNQKAMPHGTVHEGMNFQKLGTYPIASGAVRVLLSNPTDCVVADAVRLVPVSARKPVVIDDQQPGFEQTGDGWITYSGMGGYGNTVSTVPAGDGTRSATWRVNALAPGSYAVHATWIASSDRAINAPFHIYDGTTHLATVRVNQQLVPAGMIAQGVAFHHLGVFPVRSGTLRIVLTNDANGYVVADAVHVAEKPAGEPILLRTAASDLPLAA